jgi:copper homeostasis protein
MLDERFMSLIIAKAKQHNLGVTFHRAFDVCKDPEAVLNTLVELGVERILTSGFQPKVDPQGLAKILGWASDRIQIQAGSGVHAEVFPSLKEAGVTAFHCTARKWSAPEENPLGFEGEWKRDNQKISALVAAARL